MKRDSLALALDKAAQIMSGTVTYVGYEKDLAIALIKLWQDKGQESARPEALPSATALAMEGAPTIKDAIMRVMRDHYWDSLEPQKELVLKHIESAMRHLHSAPSPPRLFTATDVEKQYQDGIDRLGQTFDCHYDGDWRKCDKLMCAKLECCRRRTDAPQPQHDGDKNVG